MAIIDIKLKSYDELQFEIMNLNTRNYLLQQRIDNAIEWVNNHDVDDGWELLEILEANENK